MYKLDYSLPKYVSEKFWQLQLIQPNVAVGVKVHSTKGTLNQTASVNAHATLQKGGCFNLNVVYHGCRQAEQTVDMIGLLRYGRLFA